MGASFVPTILQSPAYERPPLPSISRDNLWFSNKGASMKPSVAICLFLSSNLFQLTETAEPSSLPQTWQRQTYQSIRKLTAHTFFYELYKTPVGRTTHEDLNKWENVCISALTIKNIMGPGIRDGWVKAMPWDLGAVLEDPTCAWLVTIREPCTLVKIQSWQKSSMRMGISCKCIAFYPIITNWNSFYSEITLNLQEVAKIVQ